MSKKLFASLVFAALLLALFLPSSEALAATKKKRVKREYWKPFAQVVDEEETEEDCADCGEEEEEEEEPACAKDTWTCGSWSACSAEGSQTRTCKMTFDCKLTSTASPATSQKCTPPVDETKKAEEEARKKALADKAAEDAKAAEREKTAKAERARKAAEDAAAVEAPKEKTKEDAPVETTREVETPKDAATVEIPAPEKEAEKDAPVETTKETEAPEDAAREAQEATDEAERLEEEELRQAAEDAARLEAKAELQRAEEAARNRQTDLAQTIQQNEVFREIIETLPPPAVPPVTDLNNNGIADNLEQAIGVNVRQVDEDLVKVKADLAVVKERLVKEEGKSEEEAEETVKHEFKKKKVEKRNEVVKKFAEKRFRVKIESRTQGMEEKGYSDEAAAILDVDPREKQKEQESFSPLEKKLFGVDVKKKPEAVEQKCTTSIQHGTVLSSDGFTVLAACPRNKPFTLVLINERGEEIPLETKNSSDDNKIVFARDKKLPPGNFPPGNYVMQVKPAVPQAFSFAWFASALNAGSAPGAESDPVLVNVVPAVDVPAPEVKQIENVEVAGVRDLKVTETQDGKIRVTGLTDITTMVVGTFESAVFTSAILADVSTGAFEVVSPRKLDSGDHGVVIYATRVEDSLQSKPVKMAFTIVPRGEAAASTPTVGAPRPVAITGEGATKKFPLVPVLIFGGVAVLFIGIGLFLKGKKAG